MFRKTNVQGLLKDEETGVVHADDKSYEQYLERRKAQKQRSDLEKKVENIECSMSEIKSLLNQLLNKAN